MFTLRMLRFPHKAILTGGMLQEIYKLPREFISLMYKNFSDGIICGMDYFIDNENLYLSAGVFRLDGEIYFLPNDLNLSALTENLVVDTDYYITLKKTSRRLEQCIDEVALTLTFTVEQNYPSFGKFVFIDATSFKLPEFAKDSDPFKNIFSRRYFNLLEIPFADRGIATFHPLLFRLVKKFLLTKQNKTPFDYALLVQLQSSETISIETISAYITEEQGQCNFDNRADLFKAFCHCLIHSEFKVAQIQTTAQVNKKTSPARNPRGKLI